MAGGSVIVAIICEMAKQLFEELGAKGPSTSSDAVKNVYVLYYGKFLNSFH
jgi:hypothetical protein